MVLGVEIGASKIKTIGFLSNLLMMFLLSAPLTQRQTKIVRGQAVNQARIDVLGQLAIHR